MRSCVKVDFIFLFMVFLSFRFFKMLYKDLKVVKLFVVMLFKLWRLRRLEVEYVCRMRNSVVFDSGEKLVFL